MKLYEIKTLYNKNFEFDNHFDVVKWVEQKMRRRIQGRNISPDAPYRVDAKEVDFTKLKTLFLRELPIRFGNVSRFIAFDAVGLTSLAQLKIDGGVKDLDVTSTEITSLEGCPKVTGHLVLNRTPITSLKGISSDVVNLHATFCKKLETIDAFMPVLNDATFPGCNIKHLKDIHKLCPNLEKMQINANPIESHILGVLKLPKIKHVFGGLAGNSGDHEHNIILRADKAFNILKKYLDQPFGNKRILDCQTELLEAELTEYAKM